MPLKLEQAGKTIDTLEMRVSLLDGNFGYASKPLLMDTIGHTIDGSIQRVPPLWCVNRKRFLNYYVPSSFLKCIRYSSNFLDFLIGVENLVLGLRDFGFLLGDILAVIQHFFQIKCACMNLFVFISHLLRVRSDLKPA